MGNQLLRYIRGIPKETIPGISDLQMLDFAVRLDLDVAYARRRLWRRRLQPGQLRLELGHPMKQLAQRLYEDIQLMGREGLPLGESDQVREVSRHQDLLAEKVFSQRAD
jgi:hypothetical protein